MIETLFHRFGILEVIVRHIVFTFPIMHNVAVKIFRRMNAINPTNENNTSIVEGLREKVLSYINSLGIQNGDILLVHSSMGGLQGTGFTPRALIDYLLSLIGKEGTLVFPAFPQFSDSEKIDKIYNPKKTLSWTGIIPNVFCMFYPGVIRSSFPVNSLAAKGPSADKMMKDNLKGDLPHGKYSSWEYCINHNAKILYLGVNAETSSTIIHVCEDLLDDEWPYADWYQNKSIKIQIDDEIKIFHYRERKDIWEKYLQEYHYIYMLKKNNLLVKKTIKNVQIDFIPNAKEIVTYTLECIKNKNYINWKIPKKFLK